MTSSSDADNATAGIRGQIRRRGNRTCVSTAACHRHRPTVNAITRLQRRVIEINYILSHWHKQRKSLISINRNGFHTKGDCGKSPRSTDATKQQLNPSIPPAAAKFNKITRNPVINVPPSSLSSFSNRLLASLTDEPDTFCHHSSLHHETLSPAPATEAAPWACAPVAPPTPPSLARGLAIEPHGRSARTALLPPPPPPSARPSGRLAGTVSDNEPQHGYSGSAPARRAPRKRAEDFFGGPIYLHPAGTGARLLWPSLPAERRRR